MQAHVQNRQIAADPLQRRFFRIAGGSRNRGAPTNAFFQQSFARIAGHDASMSEILAAIDLFMSKEAA
jgi:hypothetical protein